jgi:hypothetical protein
MKPRPTIWLGFSLLLLALFHLNQAAAETAFDPIPSTMTECEGTSRCTNWSFHGKQGHAQRPNGSVGNLSVERYDAGGVSIRRVDPAGTSQRRYKTR